MKRLLLSFLMVMAFAAKAQTTIVKRHRLGPNTVVTDSSGMNYPYAVLQKLVSSGNYTLRAIDPRNDSTAYLIVRMSEKEKDALVSRMPKPSESKFFTDG